MIRKLSERDHILKRPAMYIGAVDLTTSQEYILQDSKIQYVSVQYVPGLIKIINEIIDNSVDVAIKTDFKHSNQISVSIKDNTVTVEDNGTGIPVVKNEDGHYLPELCWNHARAGSNFDDDDNRTQIGMNGVGSYATACFSNQFIGNTDDGKKKYKITIKNGAESFTESISKSTKQGTKVQFKPNLDMFGVEEIDETHQMIIMQRLMNLSMSFPDITFKFNGKRITSGSFKKYLDMFDTSYEFIETDKYSFAVLANEEDDFRQFSYVNGLKIPDGGTHIDVISTQVVNMLRDKLSKKFKKIKPGDIKNKLMIVAFLKDIPNPKFNSQSKEKITNSTKEIHDYFGEIEWNKFVAKVYKNKNIIDNITEIYKLKELERQRKELAKVGNTTKKPKDEKFLAPIGNWDNIILAEGDSAKSGLSAILGRQGIGYYAMFGVPPNAYDMALGKIASSDKLKALSNIIGINFAQKHQDDINFKNVIFATDADLPGFFIRGQLIGLFYKYAPNLIDAGRVKILRTPLFICTDRREKVVTWFYDFASQRQHEEKHKGKGYHYEYKKGLSSWDKEELQTVIDKDGFDNMLEVLTIGDEEEIRQETAMIIDDWLASGKEDRRKEMLDGYEFSIFNL